jgi:hypothetical protein
MRTSKSKLQTIAFLLTLFVASMAAVSFWDLAYVSRLVPTEQPGISNSSYSFELTNLPSRKMRRWIPLKNVPSGVSPFVEQENEVYFHSESSFTPIDKGIEGADPATFEIWSHWNLEVARDKHAIYLSTFAIDADPATFVLLYSDDDHFTGYAKDRSRVILVDCIDAPCPVSAADPSTFSVVNPVASCGPECHFDAQDRDHKYYLGQLVK